MGYSRFKQKNLLLSNPKQSLKTRRLGHAEPFTERPFCIMGFCFM
jgi:hypothetical protein